VEGQVEQSHRVAHLRLWFKLVYLAINVVLADFAAISIHQIELESLLQLCR
jgi:hypothetical protein